MTGIAVVDSGAITTCGPATSVAVDASQVPEDAIGDSAWSGEQLQNAAVIINVGGGMDLSVTDQTIGVMVAMGESSLTVLDRGDAAGPDSRGLFQQRDNGAWGSYEDRMDPVRSSEMFFEAMVANVKDRSVDGEDPAMAASLIAHRTQRNADPTHYARFWADAQLVVAELGGVAGDAVAISSQRCDPVGGGGRPQISDDCGPVQDSATPLACRAYAALTAEFGNFWDPAGGVACRRDEPGSDHHTGAACDYMMSSIGQRPSDAMHAQALVVVQWLMDHHEALGVTYILYDEAIWTPGLDPEGAWEEVNRSESHYSYDYFYGGPVCSSRVDRASCANTLAHIDHIHLSTVADAAVA
ncbi:hypothetical protein [Nocardiopsis sp. Huas11]|uniref:hypothetical protein n=1 Tax=Nocardiopsis sp. Huas11 TaxID=2183912 RepID=UPI0011C3523F|nr:hypothetical protein [Nocardiopsis sp. Huas11]